MNDKEIIVRLITIVETRRERKRSGFRPIYNFRPEELMKHGYVVVSVGLDATRRRVMELSKVVFHNLLLYPRWELLSAVQTSKIIGLISQISMIKA